MKIFNSLGSRVTQPHAPIEVKFRSAKRTHVPVACAKFHVNRCNKSPLGGGAKMLFFGY